MSISTTRVHDAASLQRALADGSRHLDVEGLITGLPSLALPVGNAGNITAYWKGFQEVGHSPRMLGFQAAGAAPLVLGHRVEHPETVASAIRIGNPARWEEAMTAMTASSGAIESVTDEEILEGLESANAYSAVSLDAPDGGDDDSPSVSDSLGITDDALEGVEYRESLKPLLEKLPPREKRILLLRFFGGMTQSQIAAELGISQMHVSRLLARTLAQLREGLLSEE